MFRSVQMSNSTNTKQTDGDTVKVCRNINGSHSSKINSKLSCNEAKPIYRVPNYNTSVSYNSVNTKSKDSVSQSQIGTPRMNNGNRMPQVDSHPWCTHDSRRYSSDSWNDSTCSWCCTAFHG